MRSEYSNYFVIHAPSLRALQEKLAASGVRSMIHMEEVEGASDFSEPEPVRPTWKEYEALPPARRWACVLTEDATLDRLGALFPRVLSLTVDDDPELWSMDLALHGKRASFLFTDPRFPYFRRDDDEALIRASAEPSDAQLAFLEAFFDAPRAALTPHLKMGGVEGFAKVTGIPFHYPLAQGQFDWESCIPDGQVAIFLDAFLD